MNTAAGSATEAKALEHVAHRLQARYTLPDDEVHAAIADALTAFAGRPIRAFIPILVEREVADRLDRLHHHGRRPAPLTQRPRSSHPG